MTTNIYDQEAAWKVGDNRHLILQTCDDGYDYTLFNEEFVEIDGGQLDMPELTMEQARDEILQDFGLENNTFETVDYDYVLEQAGM